jgi:hypothetical protein
VNLLGTFAKALLQAAEQFLFLAFRKFQIIIRKLGVLLLKLSFDFVPVLPLIWSLVIPWSS